MLTKNKIILILSLVLLGVFFLFGYLVYRNQVIDIQEQKTIEKITYPDDLTGKVYLTLKEKEDLTLRENKNSFGIYSFDLEENNFQEEYFSENQSVLGGGIDSKVERMLVSIPLFEQIYIADKNKNVERITKSDNKFKKEAVWSDDEQKIAFISTKEGISTSNIDHWDIVVSDLSGKEEKISTGVHPFFSPGGEKLLFLKRNGLNLIDLKTKKEKNVLSLDDVDSNFQLDLSLDKNRLIISDPLSKNIAIYEINSWDNFQLEKIYEIKTPQTFIFWPRFSPYDDKYLIYGELFNEDTMQLVAYDMKNSRKYSLLDLSFYDYNYMWINDWR